MRLTLTLLLFCYTCFTGCSNNDSPAAPAATNTPSASAKPDEANHPATISATQFLNALAKGDEATATGRLTPLAAEQIAKRKQRFAFSAIDAANFQLTKLWQPKTDEAAVEFHMSAAADGESVEFDICCFMRNVDGDWRLGGIAYDLGGGQQPVIVNYEADASPGNSAPANSVHTVSAPTESAPPAQVSQRPSSTPVR